MTNKYDWVPFYEEFANKLLDYKDDRKELINKMISAFDSIPGKDIENLKDLLSDSKKPKDIDPFSCFSIINKKRSLKIRREVVKSIAEQFNLKSNIPQNFNGVPTPNHENVFYFEYENVKKEHFDILWSLFESALEFSKNNLNKNNFELNFDKSIALKRVGLTNLTYGLFWIRPNTFLSLDKNNINYILNPSNTSKEFVEKYKDSITERGKITGKQYLQLVEDLKKLGINSFVELSDNAFIEAGSKIKKNKKAKTPIISNDLKISDTETANKNDNTPYTEEDFLNEVYINEDNYQEIKTALLRKKNLILTGSPGVGKTFMSKRLAYSLIGKEDESKIKFVQFHQSYSYEDFVMGYKPNENGGFNLIDGPFYTFCKQAQEDKENKYFFIIDEINRGNISKIFGELLLLIEEDKREKHFIKLLYKDEEFTIPKNLYIIGMMNTADRGLERIDYALRRRFAFCTVKPAFENDKFKKLSKIADNENYDKLIAVVKELNETIASDESLGEDFEIGHSYFCTDKKLSNEELKNIVKFELIPLLKEYWFDMKEDVEKWSKKLFDVLGADND